MATVVREFNLWVVCGGLDVDAVMHFFNVQDDAVQDDALHVQIQNLSFEEKEFDLEQYNHGLEDVEDWEFNDHKYFIHDAILTPIGHDGNGTEGYIYFDFDDGTHHFKIADADVEEAEVYLKVLEPFGLDADACSGLGIYWNAFRYHDEVLVRNNQVAVVTAGVYVPPPAPVAGVDVVEEWSDDDEVSGDEEAGVDVPAPVSPAVGSIEDELKRLSREEVRHIYNLCRKILFPSTPNEHVTCQNCDKQLKGDFRQSGVGLCRNCLPSKCTAEGCGARLLVSWRFVGKCRKHGGYEGFPK